MFRIHIGDTPNDLDDGDYRELAAKADGYSGSDISIVVHDALLMPVRKVQRSTHFKQVWGVDNNGTEREDMLTPCSPGDPLAEPMSWMEIDGNLLKVPVLSLDDLFSALKNNRPSVGPEDLLQQEEFTRNFGSEG